LGFNQSAAVERCVHLISLVLGCRRKSGRVTSEQARAAYDEAVDLFDRLSPETLTEALHALYRKAERDSRRRADALDRLRRRTRSA
jgi:hypothetical protein